MHNNREGRVLNGESYQTEKWFIFTAMKQLKKTYERYLSGNPHIVGWDGLSRLERAPLTAWGNLSE